ncbi:hypothetical protein DL770_011966 [Monosporascus sp. CRB-9-2]|nr:hypothetical protein DL770_011966 [Monosporascus sp. CRB-9-2]
MAGQNPDSFDRALNRFKRDLPPDLASQFSICKSEDVRDICREIQQTQGREGKLRYMRRLESFVEAMEQLSKVIEVFLNVHQFVCFIWGPIKFLLGIARTYLESFDKLLDAYARIGEVMRGLTDYQTTFEKYPSLALTSRREHLESEKVSATLYEIQGLRQDISEVRAENTRQIAQENLEKHKQRVLCIREKIRAPNYQIDQEMSTEARGGKGSGKWFFEDLKFQEWLTTRKPGHGLLYINGIPGAGMFLYARVVLENLLNQTRLTRLKNEMEHGTFPKGIEKAYERVAVRIFEESSTAEREDALKLIGWVIHARRLLRWREIQSLFCIDPVIGDVDYEERRLRVTCKELCGSLVDIHHAMDIKDHPEASISIVHETAREKWLNSGIEHAKLAVFCSRYLTSKPFASGLDAQDVTAHAAKGFYGLQDYAVQYWFDHFREYMKMAPTLDPSQSQEIIEAAIDFLKSYGLPSKIETNFKTDGSQGVLQALRLLPEVESERNEYLNIEIRTCLIRQAIETLGKDIKEQKVLANLYGATTTYKCSKPWCLFFSSGLQSADDRRRHVDKHDLPFQCHFEDCFAFQLGYDTKSKLDQHMRDHHLQQNDEAPFPEVTNKKTSLRAAVQKGDLALVRTLLDSGEDPNSGTGPKGTRAPLYLAVVAGHSMVCKLLLEKGGEIRMELRGEALHRAVLNGNQDILQLLVNAEHFSSEATEKRGQMAFCEACARGDLDIVKLLFEFGTGELRLKERPGDHPHSYDGHIPDPTVPLDYACVMGRTEVVRYLLQQGSPIGFTEKGLLEATQRGHEAIVDLVLSATKDVTSSSIERLGQSGIIAFDRTLPRTLNLDQVLTISLPASSLNLLDIKFSSNGQYVAAVLSTLVSIFDTFTGRCLCGYDRSVQFYDVENSAVIRTVIIDDDQILGIFAESLGAAILVTYSEDGLLKMWDSTNGSTIKKFESPDCAMDSLIFSEDGRLLVGLQPCDSVTLTHDARWIISGSNENGIQLWDIETGKLQETLHGHLTGSVVVGSSPRGGYFASATEDHIRIWSYNYV